MISTLQTRRRNKRKGAIVVLSAVFLVVMLACIAFAVDVGYLCMVRTQAQCCADAAALAAAWAMVDDRRLEGDTVDVFAAAREKAIEYAIVQKVNGTNPTLDANASNHPKGQIVFGRLENPSNLIEPLSFGDPDRYNTVQVRVDCSMERESAVALFFARILGIHSAGTSAQAAAIFEDDNTAGFRVSKRTGNATLMPFVVQVDDWTSFLADGGSDRRSYDPATGTVSQGSDGIPELKIYPSKEKNQGSGKGTGITPGNFGKVDIGAHNNRRQDLFRQIRDGVSAADLDYYGGELRLDSDSGTLSLPGDMGITAGMQHPLADALGQARTIPLYREATGQGHQTLFTIVGFAGIRVVDFNFSGKDKYILIQPAMVVDDSAIAGEHGSSYFVGQPVRLVR